MRLAVVVSHPIQYYAPLLRELARRIDLVVFFAYRASREQQAAAGFGTAFEWDLDLLEGYEHMFMHNVARDPGAHHFGGCDTPEIGERLRGGRFDALLVFGWHLKSYWQGVMAAKRQSIPVLVRGDSQLATPRSGLKRFVKAIAYPNFLRIFDAALVVGHRNRDYYERYHYPSERLFFSPHCVDTQRFAAGATQEARAKMRARLGVGPVEKLALFAGKLMDFKRPLDLVEAVALVREWGTPLELAVAGAGSLDQALRERAAAIGAPLHLLGFQNQSEMPAAYAAADVVALPSDARETWGLVCNEALACGVPIVTSDAVGCAPDLAADGNVGQTFPLGDVGALARALTKTFTSPPTRDSIREISDRYGLAAGADGILGAASWCLGRSKRRQR